MSPKEVPLHNACLELFDNNKLLGNMEEETHNAVTCAIHAELQAYYNK